MQPDIPEKDTTAPISEFEALRLVITSLSPLTDEARSRILDAAATFLKVARLRLITAEPASAASLGSSPKHIESPFSSEISMSPKEFLLEKQPQTDVERIACLAYYLTHYRETPHFKTVDLSLLNTEAAQPKFSNTAYASNNAVKLGYLVSSTKGQRQLSAIGERFVQALPDREAAKSLFATLRKKSKPKRSRSNGTGKDEV